MTTIVHRQSSPLTPLHRALGTVTTVAISYFYGLHFVLAVVLIVAAVAADYYRWRVVLRNHEALSCGNPKVLDGMAIIAMVIMLVLYFISPLFDNFSKASCQVFPLAGRVFHVVQEFSRVVGDPCSKYAPAFTLFVYVVAPLFLVAFSIIRPIQNLNYRNSRLIPLGINEEKIVAGIFNYIFALGIFLMFVQSHMQSDPESYYYPFTLRGGPASPLAALYLSLWSIVVISYLERKK